MSGDTKTATATALAMPLAAPADAHDDQDDQQVELLALTTRAGGDLIVVRVGEDRHFTKQAR